MKAVQITAPSRAEFIETPKPKLQPGHALVRAHRLSLCGSDVGMLHYYKYPPERYPMAPGTTGHEMIGIVEAVDAPGSNIKVGDVTLTLAPDHCAMAEYYVAPIDRVLPLPPGKMPEEYLQAQQIGTVIYACKTLPNLIGKTVAVIGQGSAGLWFNFMLKRLGAAQIIALDVQAHRLKMSKKYGATDVIHNKDIDGGTAVSELTNGQMADVVIEASGDSSAINLISKVIKGFGGHVLQFGLPHDPIVPFNYFDLFLKCVTIQTMVGAPREPNHTSTKWAIEMIASGELDVAPIITHRFPFDKVLEAYELQRTRDEGAIKIIIEMPER